MKPHDAGVAGGCRGVAMQNQKFISSTYEEFVMVKLLQHNRITVTDTTDNIRIKIAQVNRKILLLMIILIIKRYKLYKVISMYRYVRKCNC